MFLSNFLNLSMPYSDDFLIYYVDKLLVYSFLFYR